MIEHQGSRKFSRRRRTTFARGLALLLLWPAGAGSWAAGDAEGELEILLVRPNTENVIDVQQISVTFNKTMVPLGDYEKLAQGLNIDVSPKVDCQWRWLNGSTIACQLNHALPFSNAYKITVPAGLKALDGTTLKAARTESFTTLRWDVVAKTLDWKGADLPAITLTFNQPMDLPSLEKYARSDCGKVRASRIRPAAAAEDGLDPERSYEFTYERPIGEGRKCRLEIAGEARSASGSLNAKPYSYDFETHPKFRIDAVTCHFKLTAAAINDRTFKIDGCDPDHGIDVHFTAPTTGGKLGDRIHTEPPFGWLAGGEGSPEYFKQYPDEEYQDLYLHSPLLGASHHHVKIEGLQDRFGRALTGPNEIEISTGDFSPMLQLPDGFGVMEKDGPHQLLFSGVNAREVDLDYFRSHDRDDVKAWSSYNFCPDDNAHDRRRRHGKKDAADAFSFPDRLKRAVIKTDGQLNVPFASPIDFSKVDPEFKYGFFIGRVWSGKELSGGEFTAHRVCSNFFTVVTDLGILAKLGFYDSGIWVHSIKTGQPLEGVKAGLYGDHGKIFEGTTDSRGFLEVPGAKSWDPERDRYGSWGNKETLYVVAETKDDFSVLPFDAGRRGLDYYEFNGNGSYDLTQNPLRQSTNHIVHAITDRPLYKPGQKVNVKIFARHWEPRSYGLSPAKEIEIEVKDSLNKPVASRKLELSEFGTANFSFDLDAGAPLGPYNIHAKADQYSDTVGQFDVQVFTLPVFKVSVEAGKESFETGDSANFRTLARYHFGGGVAGARGQYNLNYTPGYWKPKTPRWQGYEFENAQDLNIAGYEKPRALEHKHLAEGELKTDANGDAQVGVLLPADQIKSYGTVEYGVSLKDDRGKSIAGYASAEVFHSRYQVGLKTPKWTYAAQEEITPEVIVLDRQEKPVPGVTVDLKLVNRVYKTVRRHGEGSYFYYESKTQDQLLASCSFKSAEGPQGCALKTGAAGDYYVVAIARDPRGRLTQSALEKYVTGPEYVGWRRENHDRIDIIPDRREYRVGDTIELMVKNPYEEVDALITLERFGILKQFRKKLAKGAELIKIPVDSKDYAPGFYIAVHLIKGRVSEKLEGGVDLGKPSFKMGLTRIQVLDPDTVLQIQAKADKEQYEPGDQTRVDLEVSSPGGSDVAELSVAVVDEKILQLAGDYQGRYQLHDVFYNLRGGDVVTSQMLSFLIGRRHFGKKGAPAGGDGDLGNKVRKNLLPLAYWNPAVRTNGSGKADVSFKLPDNLTTWRVLVVAADKRHRFGYGSGTFRTAKKVMVEPALPSFLTEGDQLNSRFTVFNRTGAAAAFKALLKVTGLDPSSPAEQSATIANEGKAQLEWKVKAPYGAKSAQFDVLATTAAGQDGIRETIPVYPFASYETFATYGSTTGSSITEALQLPAGIRPELGGFELLVSPSLVSHLDDTFRYLFAYPYTCWEQTLVRAIALSQYLRLKQYLSIPDLEREPEAWTKELLALMPQFQYSSGAMAYWKPDARSVDPYLTTFTALGIRWIKAANLQAPAGAEKALLGYVRRLLKGTEDFPSHYSARAKAPVLAMAAYVLSLEGDNVVSSVNRLFQERANLSLFGKSFLWMAAARAPETRAILGTLKNEIYSAADLTSGSIQFKEQADDGFVRILESTVRTNCSLLSAMIQEDPKGKFIEPLVRSIIAGRKSNRWNNTQENIFCQDALARFSEVFEKETPDFKLTGQAMDQELKPVSFHDFKEKPQGETLPFKPEMVGKNTALKLEKKGPGRVYYTARLRLAYREVRTTAVNSGMQVARSYLLQAPDGRWKPQGGLVRMKRGQLVRVNLKVSIPAVRNQVVLDDRLPAGLEPVNTALGGASKADAEGEANQSGGGYLWNEDDDWYGFYSTGGFYHREMRLHAVQYFADFIGQGEYDLAYVAQAIATGEFNANPALIEQMYEPEVYGKSTPAQFVIGE